MLHRAVSPVEFCSNLIPTEGEGSWSKPNQLIHELTNKYITLSYRGSGRECPEPLTQDNQNELYGALNVD